jgi:hypothetical protein
MSSIPRYSVEIPDGKGGWKPAIHFNDVAEAVHTAKRVTGARVAYSSTGVLGFSADASQPLSEHAVMAVLVDQPSGA